MSWSVFLTVLTWLLAIAQVTLMIVNLRLRRRLRRSSALVDRVATQSLILSGAAVEYYDHMRTCSECLTGRGCSMGVILAKVFTESITALEGAAR